MTDEEKKAWEELIYETKTLIPDAPILPKLLAADAELTALRSRLSLLEKVAEYARHGKYCNVNLGCAECSCSCGYYAALRAYDAGKEEG